jgi:membrane protein implicated in regulation of membrane protease activity
MEQGWDNDVKDFFVKILNSVALTLMWALAAVTAGLYFKLAIIGSTSLAGNIIFYILLAVTFYGLVRYLYRNWKKA